MLINSYKYFDMIVLLTGGTVMFLCNERVKNQDELQKIIMDTFKSPIKQGEFILFVNNLVKDKYTIIVKDYQPIIGLN